MREMKDLGKESVMKIETMIRILLVVAIIFGISGSVRAVDVNDPNLVDYWQFEEGTGLDANDSVGSNDGTLVGDPCWISGKVGDYALEFDGVGDHVELPDNNPIWLPQNDFAVSLWVYFDNDASVHETLLDLNCGNSTTSTNRLGYYVHRRNNGVYQFYMVTGNNNQENLISSTVLYGQRWYHIVAVRNGTTQSVYIDGLLDESRVCGSGPIDFTGNFDDNKVHIGGYSTSSDPSTHYFFDGMLDDVRIYDRALSGVEIEALYQEGTGGLIAHWEFEEGAGVDANDSVGSNDGTLVGDPCWISGKVGNFALDFDGVNDYIDCGTGASIVGTGSFSVAVWIRTDSNYDAIISQRNPTSPEGAYSLSSQVDGTLVFQVYNGGWGFRAMSNIVVNNGEWHHIVGVRKNSTDGEIYVDGVLDGSDSAPAKYINSNVLNVGRGTYGGDYFNGSLDDVRIYDWALSGTEIAALYQEGTGGLVGHWEFEEGAGTDAFDSAGSNDGTLVNGPVWTSGVVGDYALDFGGVDDHISLPDNEPVWLPTEDFTLSTWVYFHNDASSAEVLLDLNWCDSGGSENRLGYGLLREPTGEATFNMVTGDGINDYLISGSNLVKERWYHIVAVRNGTFQAIYIDGDLISDRTCSPDPVDFEGNYDNDEVNIGMNSRSGEPILWEADAIIDDIRIYNRPLSGTEIGDLYNAVEIPDTWHVDGVSGSDSNDGRSYETAFATIQRGIDEANNLDTVIVWPGDYLEVDLFSYGAISFGGKNITLKSSDPLDFNVVNNTVIGGEVSFDGTEDASCVLSGFKISHLSYGAIFGNGTGAEISNCIITGNGPCGATVIDDCDGMISNCLITDNTTLFACGVYPVVFGCNGVIENCTIANNDSGVALLDGGWLGIKSSIIYGNDGYQVSGGTGAILDISNSNVEGGLGGIGGNAIVVWLPDNIDVDPCFVELGQWDEVPWPWELSEGDYHLKSQRGRYRSMTDEWLLDSVTSAAIDGGNPAIEPTGEPMPNGGRVNMGAYGNTSQASMSEWPIKGDVNYDGVFDLVDFGELAGQWLDKLPWSQ